MSKGLCKKFTKWLKANHWDRVSEDYPGAVDTASLIDEFLDEIDDDATAEDVEQCEAAGGYVSQYDWFEPDYNDDDDNDGYTPSEED